MITANQSFDAKKLKKKTWVVTLVAVFAGVAMAWSQNKLPPVIANVMSTFDISMTTAGWLSSIFCVMGIVMAIPAAALITKWGYRVCGVIALGAGILGGILGLIAPNVTILMLSRLFEGIGVGLIAVIVPSIVTMWFPPEKRGLPMGIWGSYQMIAQAMAFLLAATLLNLLDWHGMWWFGLFLLVLSLLLYIWKIATPPAQYNHGAGETEEKVNVLNALKFRSVWSLFFIALFFCIGCFGWCTWAAVYLNQEMGLDLEWANTIVGIIYIIEIGAVIFEGWLLDKVKSRKVFGIVIALLYCFILYVAFRLPSAGWVFLFMIIYPFLEGGICTTFWTITPQAVKTPALSGGALAVLVIGMNIGMVLGPPLAGYFIENYSWQTTTIPLAMAALICALLFVTVQLYNEKGEKIKG